MKKMHKKSPSPMGAIAVAAIFLIAAPSLQASIDEDIENLLKVGGGQFKIDLRYRFEYVDQDDTPGITQTAKADTLRLRLGYLTPAFYGLTAYAEYEGNQDIFVNDYNSTENGKTQFPIVADPQENEVNQLWINYAGIPDTSFTVGRQRIIQDNHRFIGNVGWRQLEQTFDSVTLVNQSLPDTTVEAGYIWKVRDIFSRNINMNSPIIRIAYEGLGFGALIAYGYFLDYDDAGDSRGFLNSTQTYGVRFIGESGLTDRIKLLYTAEYAHQRDYERNPVDYDADYWLGEAGFDVAGVVFKAGFEQLGSDNGVGFSTPLATLHAFQGWADKFLVTPPDGIRDIYGEISTVLFGVKLVAVYHDFDDDTGRIDYGEEVDLLAVKNFGKHYSVLLKFAKYDADQFATDTEKWWLQASVEF